MPTPTAATDLLASFDAPASDAIDAIEAAVDGAPKPEPLPEPVPRAKVIHISYRLGDGLILEGACTYTVPGVKQEHQIGLRCAQLAGGLTLDPFTAQLVEQIAYIEVTVANRPPWFKEPRELPDPGLLAAVYREVKQHEARFRVGTRNLRQGAAPGSEPERGHPSRMGTGVGGAEHQ